MFFEENRKSNLKEAFDKASLNELFTVKETAKLLDIPVYDLKSDIERGRGSLIPTYVKDVPFFTKKAILRYESGNMFQNDDDIINKRKR